MVDSNLTIKHLRSSVGDKEILRDVSLSVSSGQVHAVMGPNGSGKSTLAYALMGHPAYNTKQVAKSQTSTILINRKDITHATTEERAKAGIFLALQSPIAIPGVSVMNLLRSSYQALHSSAERAQEIKAQNVTRMTQWNGGDLSLTDFMALVKKNAQALHIEDSFLSRGIHDGFSGGEKKKMEMLQALVLHPKFAIFDEIDTGLDVDALKLVARGIDLLSKNGTGVIIITHYQRILKFVVPDYVHVLVAGKIVKSGDASLAKEIEETGYNKYVSP